MERPIFLTDEHLGILESLDQTALYNMFFAVPYILQYFPELTPKQFRQRLDVYQEILAGRPPGLTICRHPNAGHQIMHVGVIAQISGPGL